MPHPHYLDKDTVIPRICDALKRGATLTAAAQFAGMGIRTLYEWQEEQPQIAQAIAYAQAEFRIKAESKFAEHALEGPDWRATESLLKRRYRDDWGDKLDLTGLPDHILLELLGGKTGTLQATQYPSAPIALLTGSQATQAEDTTLPNTGTENPATE